jgi:hypothetical protein
LAKKRLKSKKPERNKIKIPSSTAIKIDYPVFCFKHLQIDYKGDNEFYYKFIERLNKLSSLSWDQIITTQRHGFGTEKMPVDQIKPRLPNFITPDVKDLIVFRANGDNRPFLGLRKNNVFHIIFIEEIFGDVYNH